MSVSNKRTRSNNDDNDNNILKYELFNEEKLCMDVCERQYKNMGNILEHIIQANMEDIEYIYCVKEVSIQGIKQIIAHKYDKETKKSIKGNFILEWNIIKEYIVIGKFIENQRIENNLNMDDSGHESEDEYESEYDEGEESEDEESESEDEDDYNCHYKETKKESIGHKINSICIEYHLKNIKDYIVNIALLDTPNGGYEKIFKTIEERFQKNIKISLVNDNEELCEKMNNDFGFYKHRYGLEIINDKLHKYLEKCKKKFDLIWFDATRTPSDEELKIVKKSMKREGYLILTIPLGRRKIMNVKNKIYETNVKLCLFDSAVRAEPYYNKKRKSNMFNIEGYVLPYIKEKEKIDWNEMYEKANSKKELNEMIETLKNDKKLKNNKKRKRDEAFIENSSSLIRNTYDYFASE